MLINARPRIVSNGFETFAPTQRAESLHERLVEMTNNDVNAWSFFRPVAPSIEDWDRQFDNFNSNENYPQHNPYSGYYQETTSISQSPSSFDLPKASSYAATQPQLYQPYKRQIHPQSTYQDSTAEMNCFQSQSPMIGSGFPEWHLGRRNGSFAEFSSARNGNGMKDFSYTNSDDVDFTPFSSVLSLSQQPSSYHDTSGVSDMLSNDKTSPKTVYSSYASSSSTSTSIDPLSLVVPVPSPGILSKNAWWPETPQQNKDQCQGTYEMVAAQDALPRVYHRQEQHWNNSWNTEGALTSNWAAKSIDPITISPKALTLNVSSAALSSSGSSQGGLLCLSDSSSGRSSGDEKSDFSGPETLSVVPRPVQRPRQILPDSIPPSRRVILSIPSNDFASSKTTQKRSMKAKSGNHRRRRSSPSRISLEAEPHYQKSSAPKRIEPKPEAPSARQWTASPLSTQSAATVQAIHHRDAKDDFLVRSKLAGMSYKDIRRQGKFTEAESTLRGRFRTLTKHKTARVRKPEWDENDIRLLKRAVRKLTNGSDPMKARVPWKQVADYIANNGGSYHFGNATCRKRWDELQTTGC